MPIAVGTVTVPLTQGMTRQRIIELANSRARRLGEKLNLDGEFLAVLQNFCLAFRWHWRRKSVTFNTVAAEPAYDLGTGADTMPTLDVQQIISVKLVVSPDDIRQLTGTSNLDAIETQLESVKTGMPGVYFIEPGSNNILQLRDTPDQIYKMRIAFWAVPNMTLDQQSSRVPMVPGFMHATLVKGLEAQILRYGLGDTDKLYITAKAEYEAEVLRHAETLKPIVELGRIITGNEEAVRSC